MRPASAFLKLDTCNLLGISREEETVSYRDYTPLFLLTTSEVIVQCVHFPLGFGLILGHSSL